MRREAAVAQSVSAAVLLWCAANGALASTPCQENWEPLNRPEHSGCEATGICPGIVTYTSAPPLYRHHLGTWGKTTSTDADCHRHTDCSYTDEAEDTFLCYWKMKMWEHEAQAFVDKGHPGGNCDCTGANWVTETFKPRYCPDMEGEYIAVCGVNDTSGDGPYGDDWLEYTVCPTAIVPWAPGVADWQVAEGWPVCNYPILGGLSFDHEWESDCCGSRAHLDLVTIRERVSYEGSPCTCEADPDTPHHHMDHGGDNCFTGLVPYPTYLGTAGNGADTNWFDIHYPPQLGKPYKDSLCTEQQSYEWATKWPNPPDPDDTTACWTPLKSWTNRRYLEQVSGKWRYRFTKGEWECTYGDGPGDNLENLGEHG